MIAEANPHYAGRQGLKASHKGMSEDALAMLRALRDHKTKTGSSLLFTVTPPPSIN